jgi:hypothetical protein
MVKMRRYYYEGRDKMGAKLSEKECKERGLWVEGGWGGDGEREKGWLVDWLIDFGRRETG